MKASKGFLLLDLAVVLLLLGTLLLFVLNSFKGCISALVRTKEIREAQTLAESTLFGEIVEVPANWQLGPGSPPGRPIWRAPTAP